MNKPYVFGIGFPKTGSTSLAASVNLLGIPSLHNRSHKGTPLKFHIQLNNIKNRRLFDAYSLDQKYRGFFDFGGEKVYKTLYAQYPNSLFIFHTRKIDDWLTSICYLLNSRTKMQGKVFPEQLAEQYEVTSREIRSFFSNKPNQFLEIDVCASEGWDKLCKFLDVPVPDVLFPHKNPTRYLKQ
jgi:hypothetical protein